MDFRRTAASLQQILQLRVWSSEADGALRLAFAGASLQEEAAAVSDLCDTHGRTDGPLHKERDTEAERRNVMEGCADCGHISGMLVLIK